jgi:hypothetical protein
MKNGQDKYCHPSVNNNVPAQDNPYIRKILVAKSAGAEKKYKRMRQTAPDILPLPSGYKISLKSKISQQVRQYQPPE